MVHIQPKKHEFGWKPHGEDSSVHLEQGLEIRYTTDGSKPTRQSALFKKPFKIKSGELRAIAFSRDNKGSEASVKFGILKTDWKLLASDSHIDEHIGKLAFDENTTSYWKSKASGQFHYINIDLGKTKTLTGFAYTPQTRSSDGMIEKGIIKISTNGVHWKVLETFEFGNLINDPVRRIHNFKNTTQTRYIRIESTVIAGANTSAAIAELDFFE